MFTGMFTLRQIEGMLLGNYIANVFGVPMISNNRMMVVPSHMESDWQNAQTDWKNVCENVSEIITKKCLI